MQSPDSISLYDLTQRINRVLAATDGLQSIWVRAETSDVRDNTGHCYMELLQKDPQSGATTARCRAVIWANTYYRLRAKFLQATGTPIASEMKVLVKVSVSFHSTYGFALVITDIDPAFTVGEIARRRFAILRRLEEEGVYDMNRAVAWSPNPWRIAVISGKGAAGYGDFIKHLYGNCGRLRFSTTLFEATMQGERTPASIIAALERINERLDEFDCVVIIRGGGAVSDLVSFDDYDLACNVAQFPLPVVVGIGHERDSTVLDYIANTRVKTPTAAAEALIGRMQNALDCITSLADTVARTLETRFSDERQHLAYYRGMLPAFIEKAYDNMLRRTTTEAAETIRTAIENSLRTHTQRLDSLATLVDAISPEATLRRGYTITRANGRAVSDPDTLAAGTIIETTFGGGKTLASTTL